MSSIAEWLPRLAIEFRSNLVEETSRYLVAAFGMAGFLALFWRYGLSGRKIQVRHATAADRRRELLTSLRTTLVFAVAGMLSYIGVISGVMTIYAPITWSGMPYMLATLVGLILAHDTYFYWTHRMMHHPKLFRWFHRTHHRSITPTPFTAYAFDLPEAIVQSLIVPLWLLVVPMYPLSVFLFMAFQILRNVMGHAGVELMPRRLADSRWFGWINATTHHDLHHSSFRYNYGLYFTWWDRLMSTEHPEYRARLRGRPEPSVSAGGYIPAGTSD